MSEDNFNKFFTESDRENNIDEQDTLYRLLHKPSDKASYTDVSDSESEINNIRKNISQPNNRITTAEATRKKHINHLYKVSALLFAVILVFLGFISAVDKDKTVSEKENRNLATRPKFTFSSFFSGKYITDFENYYSDTFPFRDFFIGINQKINSKFTQFKLGENSDVIIQVDTKDDDFAGEGVDLGQNTPEKTTEPEGMKENNAAYADENNATVRGAMIISGTRAMEIFSYNSDIINNYTAMINNAKRALPSDVKFYSLVAPTSVEFYGTKEYRTGSHSEREAIKEIYDKLDPSIEKIDAYSALVDKTDEYTYFRTDHHWTARGAYYAYTAFCKQSGNTAPALSDFGVHNLDGFVGTYYKTTQSAVLNANPDYVECFELLVDATNMVYNNSAMTNGVQSYVVAKNVAGSQNKYLAFISGDQPLEKITTSVANGKKILILKESYGNAFIPFLCNNYEEIYVVDPRKIDMDVPSFVSQNGIQEVMAINYCLGIANKTYCNSFNNLFN